MDKCATLSTDSGATLADDPDDVGMAALDLDVAPWNDLSDDAVWRRTQASNIQIAMQSCISIHAYMYIHVYIYIIIPGIFGRTSTPGGAHTASTDG